MGVEEQVPKMKVFTVGLDQKKPLEESNQETASVGKNKGFDQFVGAMSLNSPPSPPPGYATPSPPASVVMGPEPPIIIRKSRGYKGVLIVLLSVFLIALFALTLSEIAYNRQRDENFFRLRWAELKHRMGWDYDNMHRWQERVYNFHKGPEFQSQPPIAALQAQPIVTPSTEAPKPEKAVEESGKKASIADRLQFFRQLLEGIKKQAENMGFDGTMQVSVVQVDPLSSIDDQDPKSDSFLDGFGEVHQPQQPGLTEKSSSDSSENEMKLRRPCGFFKCEDSGDEFPNFQLPRMGAPFRPDWIRPQNFDGEDNTVNRFFPKVEMIEIPVDQQEVGTMYGRKFGQLLQEIIANRLRNLQQMNFIPPRPETTPNLQNPWWQPMRPQFPQSFPIGNGLDFNQPPNARPFHHQQQTPPPFIFFPNPQPNHFSRNRMENAQNLPNQQQVIAPEDRIQIEPPTQHFVDWKPWNSDNGNGFVNLNNEVNRGWTHQEQAQVEQQPSSGASMPSAEPGPPPPQARPILDGDTNEKKESTPEEKKQEEQQQKPVPILAIDPPVPSFTNNQQQPQPPSETPVEPLSKQENSLETETPFSDIITDDLLDTDAFELKKPDETSSQKEVSEETPKVDIPKLDLKPAVEIDTMPRDDAPKNVEISHLNILPIRELQLPNLSIDDHAGEVKESKEDGVKTEVTFPKINAVLSSSNDQDGKVDFPAVKFPMNDENNNNREHNPLFFQVDEPLQQEQQPVE